MENYEVSIRDKKVKCRDYGRGIPLTKVIDCVSKLIQGLNMIPKH
ncbi:MAG: hypothetical protein CM15mP106_4480 [Candidatus Neomarinimicrobiota bacterium]|nr:MAG: hypothetical protein CM15mP106_4480 [Candidatus Neomarinimicrobiota bacterium]